MSTESAANLSQQDYDTSISVLRGLGLKGVDLVTEANEKLGVNALQHVTGVFGSFDGPDCALDLKDQTRDDLIAQTYLETVSGTAMAKVTLIETVKVRKLLRKLMYLNIAIWVLAAGLAWISLTH